MIIETRLNFKYVPKYYLVKTRIIYIFLHQQITVITWYIFVSQSNPIIKRPRYIFVKLHIVTVAIVETIHFKQSEAALQFSKMKII